MLATPTPALPASNVSTPPLSLSEASIAWLNSAASANEWVQRLASPDHFSHASETPRATYKPHAQQSSLSSTSDTGEDSSPARIRPAIRTSTSYAGKPQGSRRHVTVRLPEHAARRWPSARTEAQAWDAPWIAALHDSDIDADYDDVDHHVDDDDSVNTATPLRTTVNDAANSAGATPFGPTHPAVASSAPQRNTRELRRIPTFSEPSPSERGGAALKASSVEALRHRRRHVRSESAPQAFGQELQVNTTLPVERPSSGLGYASPLAYPVPFWDHRRAAGVNHTDKFSSAKDLPRISSDCSLVSFASSDGSCHGDAGDVDPEQQLASAIQRSSSRRPAALAANSTESTPRARCSVSLTDMDRSDIEYTDDEGADIYSSAGPIAAGISMLFGGQPLRPPVEPRSRHTFETAIRSKTPRRARRVTSPTTSKLCSDTWAQHAGSSGTATADLGSSGTWFGLARWLFGITDESAGRRILQRPTDASLVGKPERPTTARLPLPSAISRSSSLASLGSLNHLPALVDDSDEEDSNSSREEPEPSSAGNSWSFGLVSGDASRCASIEDDGLHSAWGDLAEKRAAEARKARADSLRRKNQAICLRLTPVSSAVDSPVLGQRSGSNSVHSARSPVSPLWDRHFDVEESHPPYTRSWASVLGL